MAIAPSSTPILGNKTSSLSIGQNSGAMLPCSLKHVTVKRNRPDKRKQGSMEPPAAKARKTVNSDDPDMEHLLDKLCDEIQPLKFKEFVASADLQERLFSRVIPDDTEVVCRHDDLWHLQHFSYSLESQHTEQKSSTSCVTD